MSSFQKISSRYHELEIEALNALTDSFRERIQQAFSGFRFTLNVPAGRGFDYERVVEATIDSVYFYLSAPRGEDRMLVCKFDVKGVDQRGAEFSDRLTEKSLSKFLAWDTVILPEACLLTFKEQTIVDNEDL